MQKCPRCNEIIGDELTVCPMCKTEFTEEHIKKMKAEKESAEVQAMIREKMMIQDFTKKRYIMGGMLIASLPVAFLSLFTLGHPIVSWIIFGLFIVLLIGGIIFGAVSGAMFCPHCGRILFRNYGPHCAGCGKRIG